MEERTCPACGSTSPATAAFCSSCGAAMADAVTTAEAAPSGWALATAGMAQAPAPVDPAGPLRKEECAGWWQRLGASMLDGLILLLIGAVLGGALAGIAYAVDPGVFDGLGDWFESETTYDDTYQPYDPFATDDSTDELGDGFLILLGVAVIVFYGLSILWDALWVRSRHMAKPGQLVAGFRIVRAERPERVGTGRAFARAFSKLVYNIPNLGGLVYIVSAFTIGLTEKKQAIHDMMSGTACVRKSALAARGIGPDTVAGFAPPQVPVSMGQHVANAPNRGTTEGPPPLPRSSSSGPFV